MLGALPPARSIAAVLGTAAIPPSTPSSTAPVTFTPAVAGPLWSDGHPSIPPNVEVAPQAGLSLSLSAAPVPARMVTRIWSGQFVEMRDLLADNVALAQHFESVHSSLPAATLLPLFTRPRLREVSSLPSWMYCFLTYMAVRTSDQATRDGLAFARLIIREASMHGGQGWLDYDRPAAAALDPSLPWNALHPSLMASTILGQRSAGGPFCTVCQGFDHHASNCALAYFLQPTRQDTTPRPPPFRQQGNQAVICLSWNKGQCCFHPNPCFRLHQCASCGNSTHRARDCSDTPPNSRFRHPRRSRPSGPTPSSSIA